MGITKKISGTPNAFIHFKATHAEAMHHESDGFAARALDPALNGKVCRATDQQRNSFVENR